MARLPQPGADDGQWGEILNDFLSQSLDSGGELRPNTVGEAQLQQNAVTSDAIAPGAVDSAALAPNAITKADIGLSDVDNTSDANKPVSIAAQSALDAKVAKAGDIMTGPLIVDSVDGFTAQGSSFKTQITPNNIVFNRAGVSYIQQKSAAGSLMLTTRNTADSVDVNRVHLTGGDVATFRVTNANMFIGDSNASANKLDVDGSVRVAGKIVNVTDPTVAQDAATKNYVDSTRVNKAGDSMTGALTIAGNINNVPVLSVAQNGGSTRIIQASASGVVKFYVDNAGSFRMGANATQPAGVLHIDMPSAGSATVSQVGLSIRAMSGHTGDLVSIQDSASAVMLSVMADGKLNMNTRRIINVTDPSNAQDVATKNYVDTADALRVTKAGDTMTGNLVMNNGQGATLTLSSNDISFNRTSASYIAQNGVGGWLAFTTRNASNVTTQRVTISAGDTATMRTLNTNLMIGTNNSSTNRLDVEGNARITGRIIEVVDPVNAQDAATKNYVDTQTNSRGLPSGGTTGQMLVKSSATNYATTWAPAVPAVLLTATQGVNDIPAGTPANTVVYRLLE